MMGSVAEISKINKKLTCPFLRGLFVIVIFMTNQLPTQTESVEISLKYALIDR